MGRYTCLEEAVQAVQYTRLSIQILKLGRVFFIVDTSGKMIILDADIKTKCGDRWEGDIFCG